MSRQLKNLFLCVCSFVVFVLAIIGLGRDIFHAFEEILYDHQATLITNSAFSRLTNKVVLFGALLSLFLIPFYILKVFDKEYKIPNVVCSLKFIESVLLLVVVLLVVFVFFPLSCVLEGFEHAFRSVFLGDCLYSHVLIPLIFLLSYFLFDERVELSKNMPIIIVVIVGFYVLIYVLFVFILKTWEDFYFIHEASKKITYYAIVPLFFGALIGTYFGSKFLLKTRTKNTD